MIKFKHWIVTTPFFSIETRPFYYVQFKDWTWSDFWLHWDPKCGCWEYEDAMSDNYINRKKISLSDRITIYQDWKSHLFLLFIGFIFWLLF